MTEKDQNERYRLALESLTPGGSEYYNDLDRCVNYIKRYRQSQHDFILKQARRISELLVEIEQLKEENEKVKED